MTLPYITNPPQLGGTIMYVALFSVSVVTLLVALAIYGRNQIIAQNKAKALRRRIARYSM